MSGRWGERPLGRGMEDRVIRSQSGFSGRSAALASSKTTNRSRQPLYHSRKPKQLPTTYVVCAPSSFSSIARWVHSCQYLRTFALRLSPFLTIDSESPFRDVRSIPATFPCFHSTMKRAPPPVTPPAVVALPGGSWSLSQLLRDAH